MKSFRILTTNLFRPSLGAFLLVIVAMNACTDGFDVLNVSPTAVQEDRVDENLLFTRSLVYGALRYTEFQRAQHLYANHYVQYYAMSVDRFETGRYITRNDWLTAYWNNAYSDFGMQVHQVIKLTEDNPAKVNKMAMARIWKVFLMHRITDFWGDVPYFEAFTGEITPAYDPQELIYQDMLSELSQAIAQFDTGSVGSFGAADVLFQGNINDWIAFANGLRLRLAMRISNVNSNLAQQVVQEVFADGRLFNDFTQNALMNYGRDYGSALENVQPMGIIRSFNEYRVSNTLVDFLQSHNDPRLSLYVEPVNGQYIGLQNGLNPEEINAIDPDAFSKEANVISNLYAPSILLSHAEVEFLLAEAALKGWTTSDAQIHYETGVTSSIRFWESVLNDLKVRVPESEQVGLPDLIITDQQIADYLQQQGIAYSTDVALERIITQKWLANINQGFESFAEYRRTGFPVLNPIPNSDGLSETGGSEVPSRIRYPAEEASLNAEELQKAIARQGPDLPTTKMWWDN